MKITALIAVLLGGCTVYTYEGPPPQHVVYSRAPQAQVVYYADACVNLNPNVCAYRSGYHGYYSYPSRQVRYEGNYTQAYARPSRGYSRSGDHRGGRHHRKGRGAYVTAVRLY